MAVHCSSHMLIKMFFFKWERSKKGHSSLQNLHTNCQQKFKHWVNVMLLWFSSKCYVYLQTLSFFSHLPTQYHLFFVSRFKYKSQHRKFGQLQDKMTDSAVTSFTNIHNWGGPTTLYALGINETNSENTNYRCREMNKQINNNNSLGGTMQRESLQGCLTMFKHVSTDNDIDSCQ